MTRSWPSRRPCPDGTGLDLFAKAHPDRMFDVAIAEQHGGNFLRRAGSWRHETVLRDDISTFLQRGYDQVVHDVAIQRLPVRFAIDRAGLVGADGATHAGSFDVAYSGQPAGVHRLWRPRTKRNWSTWSPPPSRMTKARSPFATRAAKVRAWSFARTRRAAGDWQGPDDPRRIARGDPVFRQRVWAKVLKACEALAAKGITPTVADARFAKPLDREMILGLARDHQALITIEEGAVGGFGSHVAQLLAEEGVFDHGLKFRSMVLPDIFIDQASPAAMYDVAAMNAPQIVEKVLSVLGEGAQALTA